MMAKLVNITGTPSTLAAVLALAAINAGCLVELDEPAPASPPDTPAEPSDAPLEVSDTYPTPPALPVYNPGATPILISNLSIDGGGNSRFGVSPGQSLTVSVDYTIWQMESCPACIDQILIGFAPHDPQACIYDDIPSLYGSSGQATITMTAPSVPGVHYIRFRYAQAYSCELGWWAVDAVPGEENDIGVIEVVSDEEEPSPPRAVARVAGDTTCPSGHSLVTYDEAIANQWDICNLLGTWDIARLADGGSMDGPGYGCQIRPVDTRSLGHALCKQPTHFTRGFSDGICPIGYTAADSMVARANQSAICSTLDTWDSARLADGGSMDGPGYGCEIHDVDERELGSRVCAQLDFVRATGDQPCPAGSALISPQEARARGRALQPAGLLGYRPSGRRRVDGWPRVWLHDPRLGSAGAGPRAVRRPLIRTDRCLCSPGVKRSYRTW